MKKLNLVLLSGIAVLLALGILAAAAYSMPPTSSSGSQTQTNLGNQGVDLPSQNSLATTTATTTLTPQTKFSDPATGSSNNSSSGWPWHSPYYSIQTVPVNEAISAMRSPPSNAKIFQDNNTVSFVGSENVTILAFGMMPEDATNLTGMSPPSYATDDVFVIYGLIDPTLVIPSGANVHLVFVNLDDDMYHNYVVTSLAPPYNYMPMMGMMWSNSSNWYRGGGSGYGGGGMMGGGGGGGNPGTIFAVMMPFLSPANYTDNQAYYYATNFTLNSFGASYWYICSYPGHAQGGMYGKIVVNG